MFSDGPFVESKEYLAGVWVWEAPDLGCGAQARHRGVEGLRSQDRGAAVPVSLVDVRTAITQAHHEEWARVVASTADLWATDPPPRPADGAAISRATHGDHAG